MKTPLTDSQQKVHYFGPRTIVLCAMIASLLYLELFDSHRSTMTLPMLCVQIAGICWALQAILSLREAWANPQRKGFERVPMCLIMAIATFCSSYSQTLGWLTLYITICFLLACAIMTISYVVGVEEESSATAKTANTEDRVSRG